MSHISTGVEYALHCLLLLADLPPDAPEPSARDLAELQGIPAEYVAKLFTKLNKAGLVIAAEGVKGGFALARKPERISVRDVVDAVDGAKPLFDCREIRSRCAVFGDSPPAWASKGVCSIHAVMQAAEKAMRATLEAHTLADLAARTAAKAPASFAPAVVHWLDQRSAGRRAGRG
ncbi:Rrf2 family transcriptional regulator [Rugamonas sp.]|uniref:RrF2 family transcriptional regulator n=1 Tax=Rugamonas sp. TaxID=1926287 RepID=UPI0025E1E6FF|nr:Rrf2 family transcriptional regulator [Rugamonas sp.]